MKLFKEMRKHLKAENRLYSNHLVEIPREKWLDLESPFTVDGIAKRVRVLRSKDFLVQEFEEGGTLRLSIIRCAINIDGRWEEGISWDQLQQIKRQCGHADRLAIEVYPPDKDIVNVANMRHLWLVNGDNKVPVVWTAKPQSVNPWTANQQLTRA